MRILIVKLSAIGDVVQSLPVLASLRSAFPGAHIGWVVGDAASGLLLRHPMLDEVIVFPRKKLGALAASPLALPKFFTCAVSFLRRLRVNDYDFVLDLQGLLKSGFITLFSRGRAKVGFSGGREASSLFLNTRLPAYDPDEHAVTRYLKLASHIGARVDRPAFPTGIDDADREELHGLLEGLGLISRRIVCLIPGAAWGSKRWTSLGFAEVADYCSQHLGLSPVIVGGDADKDIAWQIMSSASHPVFDLTGRTGLKSLAALFEVSTVVLSTDTGPMHLAA
ncbi:MAG: glycosyltransferase family 9 protein, partial [Desulfobacteraceae bacterium]|nr:glycosyltransferase family 9 protein [Desulfobacteraceae bacterium]